MDWLKSVGPYIGYVAGALTVVSFLPQVVRAWRTGETHDLSLGTFVLFVVAAVCWLAYGVVRSDWPVIATNSGTLVLNGLLLAAKLKNG